MIGAKNAASSPGLRINKGGMRQVLNRFVVSLLHSRFHALDGFGKFAMMFVLHRMHHASGSLG